MSELTKFFCLTCLPSLFALAALATFLISGSTMERKYTVGLSVCIGVCTLLIGAEVLLRYEDTLPTLESMHYFANTVMYILRPLPLLAVIYMVTDFKLWVNALIALPQLFNTVLSFASLFTPVVYDYSETNELIRGTFGYLPHIVGLLYMTTFIVIAIIHYHRRKRTNASVLAVIFVICLISGIIETLSDIRLLTTATVLSLVLFYVFSMICNYRSDMLTGALNRKIFYIDAEKQRSKLTALVSIDVNGLKLINDTKGHLAGDEALKTVAACCIDHLYHGCKLYRTGGDEFVLLCTCKYGDVQTMVDEMVEEIANSGYGAAFGIADFASNQTLDDVFLRADTAMYAEKRRMKEALRSGEN